MEDRKLEELTHIFISRMNTIGLRGSRGHKGRERLALVNPSLTFRLVAAPWVGEVVRKWAWPLAKGSPPPLPLRRLTSSRRR